MWEALEGLFEVLSGRQRPRPAFELRSAIAPAGSAAKRDDFSHCWMLQNTGVKHGAGAVTFAWRRGPDGKSGEPIQVGVMPLMSRVPLDGITRPSRRPAVSAQVSWTERDGSSQRTIVHLD